MKRQLTDMPKHLCYASHGRSYKHPCWVRPKKILYTERINLERGQVLSGQSEGIVKVIYADEW